MSRRKIEQLRALARSTTFPAERDSANAKADALEAKLKAEQPQANPYAYSWQREHHQPERERKPKQPWRGSPGDHDELYAEALARALKELESDHGLPKSQRLRDILARKMALDEMLRAFGMD